MIKMDDVFGYGKAVDDDKWWFDFDGSKHGGMEEAQAQE
jgi:hypothetical protein